MKEKKEKEKIRNSKKKINNINKVPTSEGKTLAEKFDVPFFETSAKTRVNVDDVFFELVRLVKKYKTESVEPDDEPTEAKGCCVMF